MTTLTKLAELMAKATPDKWVNSDRWVEPPDKRHPIAFCGMDEHGVHDAALIVAAINALPGLLAVAEAAQEVQYQAARFGPFDGEQSLDDAFTGLGQALLQLSPNDQLERNSLPLNMKAQP